MCKPHAVASERKHGQHGGRERATCGGSGSDPTWFTQEASYQVLTITSRNSFLDQFEPWYFGFAFAYVFRFGASMPDPPCWSEKQRHQRQDSRTRNMDAMHGSPVRSPDQLEIGLLGFTSWNLFFRSALNLNPSGIRTTPLFGEAEEKFRPSGQAI